VVAGALSQTLPNGLVVSMAADRTTVPIGGTVTFTLRVANPTVEAITYVFNRGDCRQPNTDGNFTVSDFPPGIEIYPQQALPFTTLHTRTLPAGHAFLDTIRLSPTQHMFREAGTYTASVDFLVVGGGATLGPLVVTAQ
jgi:hypothetical protein